MSNTIFIRKANIDDLEEILRLIDLPIADNYQAMEFHDAKPHFEAILDDQNYFVCVASSEHGIIGMICLIIIMQMTHQGSSTALITDLIADPESGNVEQTAARLIEHVTKLAEDYGCYKTVFHTDYQIEESLKACDSLGFIKGAPCYQLPEE